tara:strand:- start:630 stop:1007 length:378 start_codon:yes stop_codon:yes gene_type:complete
MNAIADEDNPVTTKRIRMYEQGLKGRILTNKYKKLTNLKRDFLSLFKLKMELVDDGSDGGALARWCDCKGHFLVCCCCCCCCCCCRAGFWVGIQCFISFHARLLEDLLLCWQGISLAYGGRVEGG